MVLNAVVSTAHDRVLLLLIGLLVSHHLETFQKTVMQATLHATVAHPGFNTGHFCDIFGNPFRKRLLFIMGGFDREKVLDPWPLVMQMSKGLALKGLALSRHEPSRRTVVRLAEPHSRTLSY